MKPKEFNKIVYSLIVLFMVLNVVDLALTVYGVGLDGTEETGLIFDRGVTWLTGGAKLFIAALLSYSLYRLYRYSLRDDSPIAEIVIFFTLIAQNIYYLYVVANNLNVLMKVM